MTKRWLAAAMACALLLTGCGGKQKDPPAAPAPSPTPPPPAVTQPTALDEFRDSIPDSTAQLAVAYLGYGQLTDYADLTVYLESSGFYACYPLLSDLTEDQFVQQEGGDLYLVVPLSPDTALTVSDCRISESGDAVECGEPLHTLKAGQPVLLQGNVSDIVPNLWVTAQTGQQVTLEYIPSLSMMDGSLLQSDGVYDCSDYELLLSLWSDPASYPSNFCGTWTSFEPFWGWRYDLSLLDSGACSFTVLGPEGEPARYEGQWFLTVDSLLSLELSLVYGLHPENPETTYISGLYFAEQKDSTLYLTFNSGEILTTAMEGNGADSFVLTPGTSCVSVHYASDLRISWDNYDWVIVDDTVPEEAVFCTTVPVDNFTVVSLSLKDIGPEPEFDVTEVFDYGTLNPERPLCVILTNYGSIPSYGISFTDPDGVEQIFGVALSGRDGSLILTSIP